MVIRKLTACLALGLYAVTVMAGDWPSWRGPNRDDISTETGLLKVWPEGGPAKLWTSSDAGLGYSGFAVVGDVLYTMGSNDTKEDSQDFVIALDAATGKKIWETAVGKYVDNGWGGGPRSTPTISADGQLAVAIGSAGDVVCVATADGKEVWRSSLNDLGGQRPNWNYCESALIDGEKVLVTPGGAQGTVACLDLRSGKKVWQSEEITELAHYSSILAVDHFGKRQYIQLTSAKVFGLDENGKLLWQHDFPGRVAVIPTPIYHKGMVYVTAGYGAGCMMLNITADNKVEKIYENKVMKNHHGGALLHNGHIYGHSDATGIVCQELETGNQVWSDDQKNKSKGAVAFADGMLYCLSEDGGDCFLVEATPEGYKEVSRFRMDPQTTRRNPQGRIWTHPVICNGKLYLRDQEIVCCYDISGK